MARFLSPLAIIFDRPLQHCHFRSAALRAKHSRTLCKLSHRCY